MRRYLQTDDHDSFVYWPPSLRPQQSGVLVPRSIREWKRSFLSKMLRASEIIGQVDVLCCFTFIVRVTYMNAEDIGKTGFDDKVVLAL